MHWCIEIAVFGVPFHGGRDTATMASKRKEPSPTKAEEEAHGHALRRIRSAPLTEISIARRMYACTEPPAGAPPRLGGVFYCNDGDSYENEVRSGPYPRYTQGRLVNPVQAASMPPALLGWWTDKGNACVYLGIIKERNRDRPYVSGAVGVIVDRPIDATARVLQLTWGHIPDICIDYESSPGCDLLTALPSVQWIEVLVDATCHNSLLEATRLVQLRFSADVIYGNRYAFYASPRSSWIRVERGVTDSGAIADRLNALKFLVPPLVGIVESYCRLRWDGCKDRAVLFGAGQRAARVGVAAVRGAPAARCALA